MDNLEFGAFIAQLRKEKNITQKELADQLHVTDKAVSKWETGKGFPDLKLMEPLAQALGVTLVELIQCQHQQADTLTMEEAETVVAQAMDQSQQNTARRYLALFRWILTGIGTLCLFNLLPYLFLVLTGIYDRLFLYRDLGVIGGADGPTAIITATAPPPQWLLVGYPVILLILFLLCIVLAVRVRSLEKKLK